MKPPAAAAIIVVTPTRITALIRSEFGTCVEAEPAEPQNEDTNNGEGDVVARDCSWFAVVAVLTNARPQEVGTHQGRPATGRVNDGGTGEVAECCVTNSDPVEDAVTLPEHVDNNRVDECSHHCAEDQVTRDLGTTGHCARCDRDRSCGEDHLEEEWRVTGVTAIEAAIAETAQEEAVASDPLTVTKGNAVAHCPEGQCTDAHIGHVLGHDVGHVLGSGETGFDEPEPGLHQEDQDAGDEHPDVVECCLDQCGLGDLLGHCRCSWHKPKDQSAKRGDQELTFHGVTSRDERLMRRSLRGGQARNALFRACSRQMNTLLRQRFVSVSPLRSGIARLSARTSPKRCRRPIDSRIPTGPAPHTSSSDMAAGVVFEGLTPHDVMEWSAAEDYPQRSLRSVYPPTDFQRLEELERGTSV